jgi:hypothetical protein
MATIYTWDCKTVDVYPTEGANTDVVYNVHWRLTGTSDQLDPAGNAYSVTNIGTEMIDTSDITNFIPIEDVTNAEVTAWVEASMGADQVTALEASIQSAIDLLITPTSITMQIGGGE